MSQPTSDRPRVRAAGNRLSASVPSVARDQAGNVGHTAAEAGRGVAETAADQLGEVGQQTRRQAGDLLAEAREQAAEQARAGQHRAGESLRALASELQQMADGTEGSGPMSDVAKQVAERVDGFSGWLERHEPGDLVEQVQGFARRRPGLFLAGTLLAGAVVGRITRGAVGTGHDDAADDDGVAHDAGSHDAGSHDAASHDAAKGSGAPASADRAPSPAPEVTDASQPEVTTVGEYVEQLERRGEFAQPTFPGAH